MARSGPAFASVRASPPICPVFSPTTPALSEDALRLTTTLAAAATAVARLDEALASHPLRPAFL